MPYFQQLTVLRHNFSWGSLPRLCWTQTDFIMLFNVPKVPKCKYAHVSHSYLHKNVFHAFRSNYCETKESVSFVAQDGTKMSSMRVCVSLCVTYALQWPCVPNNAVQIMQLKRDSSAMATENRYCQFFSICMTHEVLYGIILVPDPYACTHNTVYIYTQRYSIRLKTRPKYRRPL